MKTINLLSTLVLLQVATVLTAQTTAEVSTSSTSTSSNNLVQNGSFELTNKRICGRAEYKRAGWISSANNTTVDLFSSHARSSSVSAPDNYMGSQTASDGDNYAGIIAYYGDETGIFKTKPGYQRYSEYLQVELAAPLEAGHAYQVSFDASLAEKSAYAVSGLGVYFSDAKMDVKNNAFLQVRPHMITGFVTERDGWENVSGTYVAKGGEKFMTIGCFAGYMDGVSVIAPNTNNSRKAYYYLDNVSVAPDTRKQDQNDVTMLLFGSCFQLQNLNFELDKAVILPGSFDELNTLAKLLRSHPQVQVYLDGHTDKTGTEAHNDSLSIQRAESVKTYLAEHGVGKDQLRTRGYGESQPIDKVNEESATNRRVEITVCPIAVR